MQSFLKQTVVVQRATMEAQNVWDFGSAINRFNGVQEQSPLKPLLIQRSLPLKQPIMYIILLENK